MTVDPQPTSIDSPKLYDAVVQGCTGSPKTIPCKFLYDDRGSQLFNQICELDEYYVTRTEMALTRRQAPDIAAQVGSRARLVELGAGSGLKTRLLIAHLHDLDQYLPVDISAAELQRCVRRLQSYAPKLPIEPICADYTGPWSLPDSGHDGRTLLYYPGSTIGNFSPPEASSFLSSLARRVGPRGTLLIGVDLVKDPARLEAAYNDAEGVTAEFNLNLLRRINRECNADFDLQHFEHQAIYQPAHQRIEMQLVSQKAQTIDLPGQSLRFEPDEPLITEHSYKYRLDTFAELAEQSQWRIRSFWTDDERLFSLWLLDTQLP